MAQTPEGIPKQKAKMLGIPLEDCLQKEAEGLKRCTKCKEWKLKSEFGKDKSRGDGINPTCITCKRVKVKKNLKGRPSNFKGKTLSEAAKKAIGDRSRGNKWRLGKTHTEETKQKLREKNRATCKRGADSHSWKGGVADKRKREQETFRYKDWRKDVFTRDKYTCQHCGDDRGGNLHAHHIKPWAGYPDLRYEISNGLTLCRPCHEKVHLKPIPTRENIRRRKKHGNQ